MALKEQNWSCIKHCGACCKLDPIERAASLELLSSEQQDLYLSMAGSDGWCTHYDRNQKICMIYSERPYFCKVENLEKIFQLDSNKKNEFAINCCKEQIKDIYGGRSKVMKKYLKKIRRNRSASI